MAITTINNTLFCKWCDAVYYACVNGISEKILFTYNNNTMLNFCKMFLITENSPSNKESTKLQQEKWSNIDYSRIKWYQMCGKIHLENYKYATYNIYTGARMSLTGVGCRLQTCSRLASERFNSAFCAPIFTWEQTLKKKQQRFTYSYQLCDVYRKSYVLFLWSSLSPFFFPFTFCPSHFPSEPHPLSRQLFIVWIEACSTLTNRFPCLKLISCNNINKLCHLIALFFPQIAAEREWLPLEVSSHATIAHSDILLIVFEKRNFIAKALG